LWFDEFKFLVVYNSLELTCMSGCTISLHSTCATNKACVEHCLQGPMTQELLEHHFLTN